MSRGDRDKWQGRYAGGVTLMPAASVLREAEKFLPKNGRAIDVAGGVGRHSLWLAKRGLRVTLADISENALSQAKEHAEAQGLELETVAVDLESDPFPAGPWDLIVDTFYYQDDLFDGFQRSLAPGGVLVFCQPTVANLARNSKPSRRFLIEPGRALELVPSLEILKHWEGWTEAGSHEVHLVAQQPLI